MKNTILIFIFLIIISCGGQKNLKTEVNFKTNYPVRLYTKYLSNNVTTICVPIEVTIKNNSLSNNIRLVQIITSMNTGRTQSNVAAFVQDFESKNFEHSFSPYESINREFYLSYTLDLKDKVYSELKDYIVEAETKKLEYIDTPYSISEFQKKISFCFSKFIQQARVSYCRFCR